MSLYRSYRPTNFDDVIGQNHIVATLMEAVKQGQLSHAYLFAGVRGTGKTSTARILAKTLLIGGLADDTIKKQILQAIDDGNLVDLIEIDAASNRGIDDIRNLIEKIQFTPVVSAAKVYIIDEAHMLTKEAFNALLKTLEEPPPYAYFILATTEIHKIPPTIQSRCQRFLFRQIDEKDIVSRLRYIADKEGISIDDEALGIIAHHVQGGMRDAISLLDQLRSLPVVSVEAVKERVGETGHEFVGKTFDAVSASDRSAIVSIVRQLEERGIPSENFVRLLLGSLREQLHTAIRTNQSTKVLEQQMDKLLQAAKDLRSAPVAGLVLESALLSMCTHESPATAAAEPVIQESVAAPVVTASKKEPTIEPVAHVPGSSPLTIPSIRNMWPSVVEKVEPASARMSLKNGQIHSITDDTVIVRFSSGFHREKASVDEGIRSVEKALIELTGMKLGVKYLLDSDIHSPPPLPEEDQVDLAAAAMDIF